MHEPVAVPVAPVAPVAPVIPSAETSAASVAEPDDFSAWLVIFEGTSRGVYPFNKALYDAVRHDRVRHAVHNSKVQAELTYRRFSLQGGRNDTDSSDSRDDTAMRARPSMKAAPNVGASRAARASLTLSPT